MSFYTNISKYEDPHELWEAIKIAIIANSQVYCNERAENRKLIISQLEEKIIAYQHKNQEKMKPEEAALSECT